MSPVYYDNTFDRLNEAYENSKIRSKRVCIVGDTNTAPLYAEAVEKAINSHFDEVFIFTFKAGEEHKNLGSIEELYAFLLEHHFDRHDSLLALGGGVVGDMTGFAAATYKRGISFVQVPTTLLAMVDSSIGGKTGVDFMGYKNMVGAFHMPEFVYENPSVLRTLDDDQFASGMGEVLKSALLGDEEFFEWILDNMDGIIEHEPETILEMVRMTADIKLSIVERDPTEKGERALLNLGHTIGHAIEKHMNFNMSHGKCVALGCIAAAAISEKRGFLGTDELFEIRDMCVAFDLPMFADGINNDEILRITKEDKKMAAGKIRFILLDRIGHAFICDDLTDEDLLAGIKFINGDEISYED